MEGMFYLGSDAGFGSLQLAGQCLESVFRHRFELATLHGNQPFHFLFFDFCPFLDAGVAGVKKDDPFFAMQQLFGFGDVGNVGCRAGDGMYQATLAINANVGFHAEIPLIAFLRLVHFRVSGLFPVFGRGRGGEDRGVGNRAFFQEQALRCQLAVDSGKRLFRQAVCFQQVFFFKQKTAYELGM